MLVTCSSVGKLKFTLHTNEICHLEIRYNKIIITFVHVKRLRTHNTNNFSCYFHGYPLFGKPINDNDV